MDNQFSEKPALFECGTGFPILNTVKYKNRFLYSKYNPEKSICSLIEKTEIAQGTIILIFSPCLWYGLRQLKEKLKPNCTIIAVEADRELFTLALSVKENDIPFYYVNNLKKLDSDTRNLVNSGLFKRILRIDFSGGTQFNSELYNAIESGLRDIVASFWKNRITLVKLGALYSKNLIKNLPSVENGILLSDVKKTVNCPILVCGAGESLDFTLKNLKKIDKDKLFILTVDAALPSFTKASINVNGVVSLESQMAIQNAYIGVKKGTTLFADISSRTNIPRVLGGNVIWFATEYAPMKFWDSLKKAEIIRELFAPLGSVGLVAVKIALLLRKNDDIPVFVTGLDFSYSIGRTHAKGTPAQENILLKTNRFFSTDNSQAAFVQAAMPTVSKRGKSIATLTNLKSYAEQFSAIFESEKNLFDIGYDGIPLKIQSGDFSILERSILNFSGECDFESYILRLNQELKNKGQKRQFIENEKTALFALKDLLSNGEKSVFRNENQSLSEQLKEILNCREYLYAHFPDGYALSLEPNFLKRIRVELDSFLKYLP